MTAINVPFLRRWADALDSGEYAQGRNCLRSVDDQYCCLGVACDLLVRDGVISKWKLGSADTMYAIRGNPGQFTRKTYNHIGCDQVGSFKGHPPIGGYVNLVHANDSGQVGFPGIAAYLRTVADAEEASQ